MEVDIRTFFFSSDNIVETAVSGSRNTVLSLQSLIFVTAFTSEHESLCRGFHSFHRSALHSDFFKGKIVNFSESLRREEHLYRENK